MSRFLRLEGLALLLVLESACRVRQVAVPVPPPPAPSASQPQPTAPPAPQNSPAPQPSASTPNTATDSPYQVNKPPQAPAAAPRKAARSTAPPSESPTTPTTGPVMPASEAPVPPPQLGDVVTPEQQRQLNTAIDQSLAHAQASLASIANRELSKDQQGLVEQIRKIMQQAQASRGTDLPGAKSLASRAEVLATDLAENFR